MDGSRIGQEAADPSWTSDAHPERTCQLCRSLGDVPEGVELLEHPEGDFDFVHLFVRDSTGYGSLRPIAFGAVKYDGLLWISYPKQSSKVATDLSRDVLWKLSEGTGFRPVAQVSVDEVWSAVRCRPVERVKRRG